MAASRTLVALASCALALGVASRDAAGQAEKSGPSREQGLSGDAQDHYEMGISHYELGESDFAIIELKQAYLLSRKASLLVDLARAYEQKKDYPSAVSHYRMYLAREPPA